MQEQRGQLREEFKKVTGSNFVINPRRYDKLPADLQLTPGAKDPEQLIESMREAYV